MMNFNIQLFADAQTNTTGTMSVEMKTFYEKRLIDQAEPRLVHDQFADYYPVPQNGGKTIEFRKYDSLPKASTPLTEGVTPNGQALNVTSITSDLHQYGGWTPLTDVLQMTAIDNNVVQATRVLASQAGRTMDSITRDVLGGGTNVIYAPKLSADGTETAVTSRKALDKSCTLTPKLFFQAAAQLGAMNADPIGDSYIAIIHPYAAYDLKTCKEFIEAHKYADPDTMYRGEIGKLGNIRFIETSEAKIWKDATCPEGLAVFGTLVLGAHAYGARIDGAGPWRFFVDVVLPLSRTNTAALFVVLFIYGWNQYLWPLLVTNQESMYTIVMGIQRMVNIPDAVPEWNLIMAVALLGMLPPLLVVLGMQKLFVRGLVETEK